MLPWLWIFALFWGYSSLVWGQMGVPYFDVAMKTSIKVFNQNVLSEVRIFWLDQIWSKFWPAAFDFWNCQFFFGIIFFFLPIFFQQIVFGRILPIFFSTFLFRAGFCHIILVREGQIWGICFFLNATIGFGQFFSEKYFFEYFEFFIWVFLWLKGIQDKKSVAYFWLTDFWLLFAADFQANPTDISSKKAGIFKRRV